jgi:hypothetical protein
MRLPNRFYNLTFPFIEPLPLQNRVQEVCVFYRCYYVLQSSQAVWVLFKNLFNYFS